MNISQRTYNLNISEGSSRIGTEKRESTPVSTQSEGELTANARISQARSGQIFSGKITNVTGDQVTINLDGTNSLYAHMLEAVNLNIGDELTFMIKENNGTSVVIKPFAEQKDSADSAIFKILDANNFSPTDKNYNIAKTLMDNNMPVDKAGMQKIMQQSYKYPDATIDTLVSLNKLGIKVNESSIAQYEQYISNTHQMADNINIFAGNITDFSKEIINNMYFGEFVSENEATDSVLSFNKELLSVISDDADMILFDEKTGDIQNDKAYTDMADLVPEKLNISNKTMGELVNKLETIGFDKETVNYMMDKSESDLQLLNNINKLMSEHKVNIGQEGIKEFFSSEVYNELLGNAIKKKFSLEPGEMKQPGEIDELYKSLYDKSQRLESLADMNQGGASGDGMKQTAKGIQERIEFIQNLNETFAYAQIPVSFGQNNANSELFVYMNKKNMREVKEEVSALLHLDMTHLGATDVHVSLLGGNVHTRFYVEDEESARIIDEHMTMLEKAIKDAGFSLTNEVVTRKLKENESKNAVVNEMLGDNLEQSVRRYTFDVRR